MEENLKKKKREKLDQQLSQRLLTRRMLGPLLLPLRHSKGHVRLRDQTSCLCLPTPSPPRKSRNITCTSCGSVDMTL